MGGKDVSGGSDLTHPISADFCRGVGCSFCYGRAASGFERLVRLRSRRAAVTRCAAFAVSVVLVAATLCIACRRSGATPLSGTFLTNRLTGR